MNHSPSDKKNGRPLIRSAGDVLRQDLAHMYDKLGAAAEFHERTVVMTGGAGFLGYYLTQFFLGLKTRGMGLRKLVILDRFLFGEPEWLREMRGQHAELEAHAYDAASDEPGAYGSVAAADYVLHMASIASPTYYRQYPLETIRANVNGLERLLDAYRHSDRLRGMLFFSSSEVYGNPSPDAIPTPETYLGQVSCTGPRACYDESKRLGETLCYVYATSLGMPIRIVRPFNLFGPGMRREDRRLPADFARNVLSGEDIVIHSDGRPTRTYCYIGDAIPGILKALTHHSFDTFNIGMDGEELSVARLADIYAEVGRELTGYRGVVVMSAAEDREYLTDNPQRRCPDLTKARTILGYAPDIGVRDGVRRYLSFLLDTAGVRL
ncbi:NAD-dependent epimerase/dehydratase family protein [Paenibacillus sp. HB172176]|uniref:NAD-dependent epimerase/dehydratase family protein n=1 Tax=Paenibacillus sp. HB172176 TaxID=2493690 RepID=UPI001439AECE|nr:NAD-dependent epimerase/dehydratase family protein [Paenibacillus sp. HB172176]